LIAFSFVFGTNSAMMSAPSAGKKTTTVSIEMFIG
jgi:hypothetical protein